MVLLIKDPKELPGIPGITYYQTYKDEKQGYSFSKI